jgi:hypothetical protein
MGLAVLTACVKADSDHAQHHHQSDQSQFRQGGGYDFTAPGDGERSEEGRDGADHNRGVTPQHGFGGPGRAPVGVAGDHYPGEEHGGEPARDHPQHEAPAFREGSESCHKPVTEHGQERTARGAMPSVLHEHPGRGPHRQGQ